MAAYYVVAYVASRITVSFGHGVIPLSLEVINCRGADKRCGVGLRGKNVGKASGSALNV